MASRLIKDLEPVTREMVNRLLTRMAELGNPVFTTCTLRSRTEQDQLYARGRTSKGLVITNAKAGQSAHNYGMAADLAFVHGVYSGPWEVMGKEAEKVGLVWGGDWKSRTFKDRPHVERPDWRKYIV